MANRAYVSFWTRDYSEQVMLDRFERLLQTIPLSATEPRFLSLTVRAIDPSEAPLAEHDLRRSSAKPAEIIALAREHTGADCAYEVEATWDLWTWESDAQLWKRGPERLLLICQGEEYDSGAAAASGHYLADAGLEHLYTGHGRLLAPHAPRSEPSDPTEAAFLNLMSQEKNLHEYHQKTRENIQQLMQWVQSVERALPVERLALWSEGEENLEARLDEILAVH